MHRHKIPINILKNHRFKFNSNKNLTSPLISSQQLIFFKKIYTSPHIKLPLENSSYQPFGPENTYTVERKYPLKRQGINEIPHPYDRPYRVASLPETILQRVMVDTFLTSLESRDICSRYPRSHVDIVRYKTEGIIH